MSEYPHLIRLGTYDQQGLGDQVREMCRPIVKYGTVRNVLLLAFAVGILIFMTTYKSNKVPKKSRSKKKRRT